MPIVVIVGIIVIWAIFEIVGSIGQSISESVRYAAEKKKAEEKQRFESFKKIVSQQHEEALAKWQSVLDQELLQAEEIQNEKRRIEQVEIDKQNELIRAEWTKKNNEVNDFWQTATKEAKILFRQKLADLDNMQKSYFESNPVSVLGYNNLVLATAYVSNIFPAHAELEYIPDTKTLIVNYTLPTPSDIPTLKEVKFIKTKDTLKESHISQNTLNKLYDEVIYQIVLATVAKLFSADAANALDSLVFNGWVNTTDKSTGHPVTACIVSLHAIKNDVESINFKNVDPKECFKKLKGVGSSQLYGLIPIAPIMKINTYDKRFIESYEVAKDLDDSVNLAAMNWEDFEHLVREIFEKKFSRDGIEVKVTQSSRDKGVDAIAFDPDPLRGGKIVIQAKRYTNVVGVSAVRDLFGTVMNEGATKGILVTTSSFGHDAYDFAKNKPITLICGGELLNLLLDCGYKAKIDLKEAKRIASENKDG
jgi:restriction system protein